MAQPRYYVPGPSVSPNLGSPAQYLKNIGDIAESNKRARIAEEKLAADKLFRDQTMDFRERQQDYTEAAPERAEQLRMANLGREVEKVEMARNLAEGAQYSGGNRLETIESRLMQDPGYAGLDEQGKLAARNQFVLSHPSALTPPKQFVDTMKSGLIQSGLYTGDEINSILAKEVSSRYPTADPSMIEKLVLKPKDMYPSGMSNNQLFSGRGTGGGQGGSGSYSTINDPTAPATIKSVLDDIASERQLDANPDYLLGQRLDFEGSIPGTSTDVTRQDLGDMASAIQLSGEVSSPTAMRATLINALTGEGNLKEGYDWRTQAGKDKLISEAKKAQESEERLLNRKGGDISAAGQAAGGQSSLTDMANAAFEHNEKLLSRMTPQAMSDSGLVSAFLASLGGQQTTPGKVVASAEGAPAPEVVSQPVPETAAAPSPEQQLIASLSGAQGNQDLSGIPGIPDYQQPAPQPGINIGGQVPAEAVRDRLFNVIKDQAENFGPAGVIRQVVEAAPGLIRSLIPPGPGVLEKPQQAPVEPRQQRQAAVDSMSGPERAQALSQAKELASQGVISLADGEGRSRDESLLIAYLKYLEGQ